MSSTTSLMSSTTELTTTTTADVVAGLIFDVNQHWMIYAGSLVFLMQAGFSLLEAGSISAKNSTNILFKNLLDACISAGCFFGWGYAFAYGDPNTEDDLPNFPPGAGKDHEANGFIGTSNFFLTAEDGKEFRNFFFQWAFAATAATIVSGAVAGRIKVVSYFIYSIFVTSIIYPVVVHWVWADAGFMCNWHADVATKPFIPKSVNLIDFAGSGVVHLTGGICALVGAIFTGPRIGRFPDKRGCGCFTPDSDKVIKHEPHNRVFASIGVLLLWFGWYGFNAGSTLDIGGYGNNAARITVTTTLAAAAGAITAMIIQLMTSKPACRSYDVVAPLNGILAGLVSITAGCNVVSPIGSIGIGVVGGIVYSTSSGIMKRLRIDDPLDAFSVHGACGIWGVVAVGFFGVREYICGAADSNCITIPGQTAMQIVGVLLIILWTSVTSAILFGTLRLAHMLRVSENTEIIGLDMDHHLGYTGILRYEEELKSTTGEMDIEGGPNFLSGPASLDQPVVQPESVKIVPVEQKISST